MRKFFRKQKNVSIVGNEVIRHADVLWREGRWRRDYPKLWRAQKQAEAFFHKRKVFVRSVLAVIALLLTGTVSWFSLYAEYAKFYPTACLGGWQNPKNAEGEPTLREGADALDFNDTNSATLLGSASQIFCGSFKGEIPENAKMKTLLVKLSWTEEGRIPAKTTSDEQGQSLRRSEGLSLVSTTTDGNDAATSTVTVTEGETATSTMQEILDAPEGAALEIRPEGTPPITVPDVEEGLPLRESEGQTLVATPPAEQGQTPDETEMSLPTADENEQGRTSAPAE